MRNQDVSLNGGGARSGARWSALAAVVIAACAFLATAPLTPSHAQAPDGTGPPSATASAGPVTVPLGLGSYCWTERGADVGLCPDTIGIITDPMALPVPIGSLVTVAYPSALTAAVLQVSPLPGAPIEDDGATLAWAPQGSGQELSTQLRPDGFGFVADLAEGLYLGQIRLTVPEGDVLYGLILSVSAATPSPDALPASGSGGLAGTDAGGSPLPLLAGIAALLTFLALVLAVRRPGRETS